MNVDKVKEVFNEFIENNLDQQFCIECDKNYIKITTVPTIRNLVNKIIEVNGIFFDYFTPLYIKEKLRYLRVIK